MVESAKANAKSALATAPAINDSGVTTGNAACGFRNLMKYRASGQCKKALTVWGS